MPPIDAQFISDAITALGNRVDAANAELAQRIDEKFDAHRATIDTRISALGARLNERMQEMGVAIADLRVEFAEFRAFSMRLDKLEAALRGVQEKLERLQLNHTITKTRTEEHSRKWDLVRDVLLPVGIAIIISALAKLVP